MSERITRKDVEQAFRVFCNRTGRADGTWALDYAPIYGGYRIVQLDGSAHHVPFGNERHKAREMYAMLSFAAEVAS